MTIFKGTKWDKAPVTVANPTGWDMGATGKANCDRLRAEPATDYDPETGKDQPNPNGIKRNRRETWVDRYARKGKLNEAQQATALNLYAAWAGFPNKDALAAILAHVDGKGCGDPLATMIDQRREFYALWKRIPDACKPFVRHVVINDLSIRSMNGCSGRAEPIYMQRLCAGLDAIS